MIRTRSCRAASAALAPEQDRLAAAERLRDPREAAQLVHGLHGDHADPGLDGRGEFLVPFAGTRHEDPRRVDPRPQDVAKLAARRHVRAQPEPAQVPEHREVRVRLDRVREVEHGRQRGPERRHLRGHDVEVVHERRRPEALREVGRVEPGEAALAQHLVPHHLAYLRHRRASSSATRASVPASRSLTSSATDADSPCSAANWPRSARASRHHDGTRRHGQRRLERTGDDPLADHVVQARGPGERDTRRDDGADAHQHALEQRGASAHEGVVLHDDRPRARGLQDAADRHARGQVHPRADLRAGAHEHVRVHHRVLADPRAHVHERRRHDHDAGTQVHAAADGGPARDDAPRPAGVERRHCLGGAKEVAEREADAVAELEGAVEVPGGRRPVAEAGQDRGLDLGVGTPAAGRVRVGDRGAPAAGVEVFEDRACRGGVRGHAATSSSRSAASGLSASMAVAGSRSRSRRMPARRSRGASVSVQERLAERVGLEQAHRHHAGFHRHRVRGALEVRAQQRQ